MRLKRPWWSRRCCWWNLQLPPRRYRPTSVTLPQAPRNGGLEWSSPGICKPLFRSLRPFIRDINRLTQQYLALEGDLQQLQDKNNEALRKLNTLEKGYNQAETKEKDVVEALQCCQQEAQDHERQLASAVVSLEKAMAD